MSFLTTDIWFLILVVNIILALWGVVSWTKCYKSDSTRYRKLYLLWTIVSGYLAVIFTIIVINNPVITVNSALTRIGMTLCLAASTITSEAVKGFRLKR